MKILKVLKKILLISNQRLSDLVEFECSVHVNSWTGPFFHMGFYYSFHIYDWDIKNSDCLRTELWYFSEEEQQRVAAQKVFCVVVSATKVISLTCVSVMFVGCWRCSIITYIPAEQRGVKPICAQCLPWQSERRGGRSVKLHGSTHQTLQIEMWERSISNIPARDKKPIFTRTSKDCLNLLQPGTVFVFPVRLHL